MPDIYNGALQYPLTTPLVIGTSAIGRIAAVGPDATLLTPDQLVYIDCTIRGRDDPDTSSLSGIHGGFTDGSRKLMHGEWRDSTFAEYAKVPLENCHVLDERRLLGKVENGGLGYKVEDLTIIPSLLIPFGGLRDIHLEAGETIVIAPATGTFGGAAVLLALAMGAQVIAMGRNLEALKAIAAGRDSVKIVVTTGNVQADAAALQQFGPVDAFFDISPPAAAKSTHFQSGILALRPRGRVSLMGGIQEDIAIPYSRVIFWNLQLKGKFMYEREDIKRLIKMVEVGVMRLGEGAGIKVVGSFGLEEWNQAFDIAKGNANTKALTVITP